MAKQNYRSISKVGIAAGCLRFYGALSNVAAECVTWRRATLRESTTSGLTYPHLGIPSVPFVWRKSYLSEVVSVDASEPWKSLPILAVEIWGGGGIPAPTGDLPRSRFPNPRILLLSISPGI